MLDITAIFGGKCTWYKACLFRWWFCPRCNRHFDTDGSPRYIFSINFNTILMESFQFSAWALMTSPSRLPCHSPQPRSQATEGEYIWEVKQRAETLDAFSRRVFWIKNTHYPSRIARAEMKRCTNPKHVCITSRVDTEQRGIHCTNREAL